MFKPFRFFTLITIAILLIFANLVFTFAQAPPPPPPPPPPVKMKDSVKIPGATVRGRVVYEDSGLPLRFGLIGLAKVDDRSSYYGVQYVKTDENGDFILEDVAAGDYFPYIKNDGILNPDAYQRLNNFDPDSLKPEEIYQKISVNGQGQFQVFIRAKRGSSFSGIVRYFDGEAAVGVRVEALRKLGDKYLAYPVGNVRTDDRGYYRFAGLPEGSYTVRVIEPVSHVNKKARSYGDDDYSGRKLLKTYYPQAKTAKDASGFQVLNGQEQTSVDVTLPERLLFDISGKVVSKQTGEPLKNFRISFNKMDVEPDEGLTYGRTVNSFTAGISNDYTSGSDIPSDWSIRSLPKGKYLITASQVRSYDEKNKITYPDVTKEVEIIDGNVEEVTIEVPLSSSIEGTIVSESGKELPRYGRVYAVNLESKSSTASNYIYSDRDSKTPVTQTEFKIDRLGGGKVKLVYGGQGFYIRSISVGSRNIAEDAIEIEEGQQLKGVKIVVASDTGVVEGKVNNFDPGDPASVMLLAKDKVSFENIGTDSFFGRVQEDGSYKISAKPGEYKIIIILRSDSPKNQKEVIEYVKRLMENAPIVSIEKNKTVTLNLNNR